jgi:transcriptional regulator with XRE-family HTH domain
MSFKKYLDDNDVNYSKVAIRLGVSRSYLNLLLNGKRYPSIDLARKIEEYTNGKIKWHTLVKPRTDEKKK